MGTLGCVMLFQPWLKKSGKRITASALVLLLGCSKNCILKGVGEEFGKSTWEESLYAVHLMHLLLVSK